MRREGKWLKAELTDYLRTCNVNDVIVQRIDDLVDQAIIPGLTLEKSCLLYGWNMIALIDTGYQICQCTV